MSSFIWGILLNCCFLTVAVTVTYVKPNYPKLPLTKEENQNLLRNCGRPPIGQFHNKVWNPEFVNRTEAPWAVAVLNANVWRPNITAEEMYSHPKFVCSGTLISSRHVLTAAHCIQPNILRHYFVIDKCGVNSTECEPMYLRTAARVFSSVRYIELNPGPNDVNGGDMAVFELTEEIPFSENVWPVCLGDISVKLGETLDLYGFGTHGTSNPIALQHASIVVSNCNDTTVDILCSYVPYQKPCGGDSGSGLIQTDSHFRKFVVATHTASEDCTGVNQVSVFGPNTSLVKRHTLVKPHLYWICEATGICASKKISQDVEKWTNLANRHRERYAVQEPLEKDNIYV